MSFTQLIKVLGLAALLAGAMAAPALAATAATTDAVTARRNRTGTCPARQGENQKEEVQYRQVRQGFGRNHCRARSSPQARVQGPPQCGRLPGLCLVARPGPRARGEALRSPATQTGRTIRQVLGSSAWAGLI
jgi:hypothetical protein